MHVKDERYPQYILDQIKKGTTTCALTCSDGVVLAADTRASAGLFIADRHVMKIQKVDNHLGMTIAGGVADAQNLVDTMRYNSNIYRLSKREPIPVSSAARLCSNILFNQRYFPYYVQIIMGGFDYRQQKGQIYNIDLFGSITTESFISTGSGSPVAYGYLESEFREGMSVNEAYKVAIQAIAAAIRRNAGTGDSINAVIIDKDGYKELSKEIKDSVGAKF
ncbi:MAG: proteasome subunit beta [Candidatus Nitrosocosmicus sp.]|jgi:proteasome beta subunit|uniref:proteasome subunit beta n=1 Tax=Candidatus Nitrosocosmicus agrestis TaxID=2563600 RepID=UPI00122E2062|nr:proteasome subunit beta [Candidatus Nitrosocosmicus sp. SS]KAA2282404.1 proteasome subunit beta [Candidatus Nitrosocosmicus sp. SS]KAF0868002.1 proteasome subunit beta [Candidatus Nitrosocosmicus sp. SS]MDR4489798.1 proteasome subunit beta [Candidatus Nitrosocosmicus sp.]HET6588754.1 proteasome subunit beta [Candidatus Nitrosocosmicus sp.]